jgi:hypothetical protein
VNEYKKLPVSSLFLCSAPDALVVERDGYREEDKMANDYPVR